MSDDKVLIFTMDNCPPCDKLKEDIRDKDKVVFMNVSKHKGARRLALRNGIRSAPSALLKTGDSYEHCDVYFDHRLTRVVAECGSKKVKL